jgi:hypothetical protein
MERDDLRKYHELLGIDERSPSVRIQKAFIRKALKNHPDKVGNRHLHPVFVVFTVERVPMCFVASWGTDGAVSAHLCGLLER